MLATLQTGVRGGKWHTLIDKVFERRNLFVSAEKVLGKRGAAGVDRQTVDDFDEQEREELARLHEQLRDDEYRPAAVRRVLIPKPGSSEKRPLGIPTVRDRVVQTALVHVIEPILDNEFHDRSFGFRHGRGCHDALRCVEELLAAGHVFVVDADLKSYFDTIPKDRLLAMVNEHFSDSRVESFAFLGYSFRSRLRFPREKSHTKLMDRIRDRLRRLQQKRHRRNPHRLPAKQRWPNQFFSDRGLYSLNEAHIRFVQSTR